MQCELCAFDLNIADTFVSCGGGEHWPSLSNILRDMIQLSAVEEHGYCEHIRS